MPTIQISAELSPDLLLQAAKQLSETELEQFAAQLLALRGRRHVPSFPRGEAELLLKINQGVPADLQARYQALIAKRQTETLSPSEHKELLQLTEAVEQWDAKRIELLTELAGVRGVTLTALMRQLGIRPQSHE